jgi:hypothetical protein
MQIAHGCSAIDSSVHILHAPNRALENCFLHAKSATSYDEASTRKQDGPDCESAQLHNTLKRIACTAAADRSDAADAFVCASVLGTLAWIAQANCYRLACLHRRYEKVDSSAMQM